MKKDDLSQGKKLRRNLRSSGDILSAGADFSDNRQITPISSTETTMRMAALASEDWEDGSSGAVEDRKYKLSGKQLLMGLLICAVIITLLQLLPGYIEASYPSYVQSEALKLYQRSQVQLNLDYLDELGLDTQVAGTNGQPLTFTLKNVTRTMPFAEQKYYALVRGGGSWYLEHGDVISCDFKSYATDKGRYLIMSFNGETHSGYMNPERVIDMYLMALKQNGLEDAFKEDFGKSLSRKNAEKALQVTDAQAYSMGIYQPLDYPYDVDAIRSFSMRSSFAVPVVVFLAIVGFNMLRKKKANDEYLKRWNEESSQRWKSLVEEE